MSVQKNEILRTVEEIGEVTTSCKYEAAGAMLGMTKRLAKEIKDHYGPLKKAASDSHKKIVAAEKEMLSPIVEAQSQLNGRMDAYDRKLEEEARLKEAELRRAEEDAALERAAKFEEAGMKEEADQELERPLAPVAAPITKPKVAGISRREHWDFEITDASQIASEFLTPDTVKIGKAVRAHGENSQKIVGPGIRVFKRTVRAAR
jgi:hypothetical protein